jgi:dTMP kinase
MTTTASQLEDKLRMLAEAHARRQREAEMERREMQEVQKLLAVEKARKEAEEKRLEEERVAAERRRAAEQAAASMAAESSRKKGKETEKACWPCRKRGDRGEKVDCQW